MWTRIPATVNPARLLFDALAWTDGILELIGISADPNG